MILGGMLSVPALLFARAAPQATWVRHFMAACQIGWSILFMWLLEGQPEAQLHVFVSLAFLAFYRDWRVIVTASLIAIAHPIVRLALVPDTYVIGASAWWRVFDQAAWVRCRRRHHADRGAAEPEDDPEISRRTRRRSR